MDPPVVPPSHIICLTAFSEAATTLRTDAEKKLVHVVVYDETSDSWRESLTSKARFVAARLHDAEIRPRAYKTDVAIVTSSPQVELRELLKTPGESRTTANTIKPTHYITIHRLGKRVTALKSRSSPLLHLQ